MKRSSLMPRRWLCLLALFIFLRLPGQALANSPVDKTEQHIALSARTAANPPAPQNISLSSTTVIVDPVNDTELSQANPNTNYGSSSSIMVGSDVGHSSRMLLDLPLWNLPPNGSVQSATLRINMSEWYDYQGYSRTITAYRVASIWQENNATWNHAPSIGEAIGSVSIATPDLGGQWSYDIDLTQVVKNWYAGVYPDYGIILIGPESDDVYRAFASSETTRYPYLSITFTPLAPTLSASPAGLTFLKDGLGIYPSTNLITIRNSGSLAMDWTASNGGTSWLSLGLTSGTLGPGSSTAIPVSVIPSGLANGTYSGSISITSSTPGTVNPSQNISASFKVVSSLSRTTLPLVSRVNNTLGQKIIALYIGISDYKNLQPSLSGVRAGSWGTDLLFANNDAKQLDLTLTSLSFFNPANGAGASNQKLVLTDSGASLANIRAALDWLAANSDSGTIVVINYSGHGGQTTDLNGDESDGWDEFIAAYDSDLVNGTFTNIITDDELKTRLDKIQSQQTIVFLDSCYSGGMVPNALNLLTESKTFNWKPSPANTLQPSPDSIAEDLAGPGRLVLTASATNQLSIESPEFNQGLFSYYLNEAFLAPSADTNHDGWISVQEAFAYLTPRVLSYPGNSQTPQLYDSVGSAVNLTRP
jgi:hypothetical protein